MYYYARFLKTDGDTWVRRFFSDEERTISLLNRGFVETNGVFKNPFTNTVAGVFNNLLNIPVDSEAIKSVRDYHSCIMPVIIPIPMYLLAGGLV